MSTVGTTPSVWIGLLRLLLVLQLLVAAFFQMMFGLVDLFLYAATIPGAIAVLFWLIAAGVASAAAWGLLAHKYWTAATLFVAEVTILLSVAYLIWVDFQSSYPDQGWRLWAALELVVALGVLVRLAPRVRGLLGKAGAIGLALLSALGLAPFLLENYVIPSRTPPVLDVSASLEEVGRSAGAVEVRGTVAWKNAGRARIWLPQAFAWVEAGDPTGAGAVGLDAAEVARTFNPQSFNRRAYVRELPDGATGGIVWLEDLEPYNAEMQPGETRRREFVVDVDPVAVHSLELRVQMWAVTSASFERPRTCNTGTDAVDHRFLADFQQPLDDGSYVYTCLFIPIRDSNTVRGLVDDEQAVVTGFSYRAPTPADFGPYAYFSSRDEDPTDPARRAEANERYSRRSPNAVVTTVAALAVPLEPQASEGGSPVGSGAN